MRDNYTEKSCFFCKNKDRQINFCDVSQLKRYLNFSGRIQPAKRTGNCTKHQKQITKAIKKARQLGLISYSQS